MYKPIPSTQAQSPVHRLSSARQRSAPHIDNSPSSSLASVPQSARRTPHHGVSSGFFDPSNDPAWFTPHLHQASSSTLPFAIETLLPAPCAHYPDDEMVHDEAMIEDGFIETSGMGYGAPADEAFESSRRYSEGDQPLAASGTSDRQQFVEPSYGSSPADSGFFQSGYTLAQIPTYQAAPSSTYYAIASSSDISPGMPLYAPDSTQAAYVPQQPRTVYGQYAGVETEVLRAESSVVADDDLHRSRSRSSGSAFQQHLQTSLAPSPYIGEPGQHETFRQPQRLGRHSASASPLPTPAHSAPSSRRPSLAHANTQAAPEYASRDVYPAPSAVDARHHSFLARIASAPATPDQQPSRKRSIDASDGDYFYGMRRHSLQAGAQYAVGQASSPSSAGPARRSSQTVSMPVTPTRPGGISRRRSSLTPGADQPSAFAPASSFSTAPPRTPTSRRSSAQAESAYSPIVSASSPSFSSSRRHHPNLTIAVPSGTHVYTDSATVPPHSAASTATSSFANYRSPYPDSPVFSPYGTPATDATGFSAAFSNGIDPDCLSPLGAAGAAVKARRRFSADPYPAGHARRAAAFDEERRRASATATFAGTGGGARSVSRRASGAAMSGLASTAEEELQRTLAAAAWGSVEDPNRDEHVGLGLETSVGEMSLAQPPPPHHHPVQVPSPVTPVTPANVAQLPYPTSTAGMAHSVSLPSGEVLSAPPSAFSGAPADVGVLERQQQAAFEEMLRRQQERERAEFVSTRQQYGVESPQSRLEQEIQDYVRAEDRLALGEKSVVILSPKIAQRSYGTEKRLLAPPPMALLLGTSWWQSYDVDPTIPPELSTSGNGFSPFKPYTGSLPTPPSPPHHVQLAPEVYISISTDRVFPKQPATTTWISNEGTAVTERQERDAPPIAGRAMSKGLAVSVPGELNKDVSTTVNAVVTICEPGTGDIESRVWARLTGKPITVISKPSKKRSATAGGVSGLHHGSLVSLYNRTKTYTGSTRYLCTSGIQSTFPLHDWHAMTGGGRARSFAPSDARDTRFVAKTAAWDAFIVYAVDVEREPTQQDPPEPTFPKPPLNAVAFGDEPKPLYYNQTVVLQDLSTGVVSPVLVLRRIDAPSICTGGGSPPSPNLSSSSTAAPPPSHHPVPHAEQPGELVSQYRPLALQVYHPPPRDSDTLEHSDVEDDERESFLGVVEDEVGVHRALEPKTVVVVGGQREGEGEVAGAGAASGDLTAEVREREGGAEGEAEEGGVGKCKRSRVGPLIDGRRKSGSGRAEVGGSRGGEGPKAQVWTMPLGEHCIWSIAQVELERYSFFVPPSVSGGHPRSLNPPSTLDPLYTLPRPATTIGPDLPVVTSLALSRPSSSVTRGAKKMPGDAARTAQDDEGTLVLHGSHLSPAYTLSLAAHPIPRSSISFKSPSLALVRAPAGLVRRQRTVELVWAREDGVCVRSSVEWGR